MLFYDRLAYCREMLYALPLAEYDLGESTPQVPVRVDFGESQIVVRQAFQLLERLFDGQRSRAKAFQQLLDTRHRGIHSGMSQGGLLTFL